MHKTTLFSCVAALLLASAAATSAGQRIDPATDKPQADLSGRARSGIASFYATFFGGRKMADGTPMDLQGDNAASRTLPLGTTALVTNLETGLSAIVTIRDRGPYVKGRIVDLSPGTAKRLGITSRQGLAKVEVAPLTVPLPHGGVKLGAGDRVASSNGGPARQQL